MLKVFINLVIHDEGSDERGLLIQKDLELNFLPVVGMSFRPKLGADKLMENELLRSNKNNPLIFKVVDILWEENENQSSLIVEIEGKVTSNAFNFICDNIDKIEKKTGWEDSGFPINPREYFGNFCRF